VKHLKADWKCDWCGQEYSGTTADRPQGWHMVEVTVDRGLPPKATLDFCCREHLDEWLGGAGL